MRKFTMIALIMSLLLFLRALTALLRLTFACALTISISFSSIPVASTCYKFRKEGFKG